MFECSSQTGETPLEEQCRCWYLKLNFFFPVFAAMESADAQVRRSAEQQKLERWCASHGIERPSDLAFYFVSYEEALKQGRAVAEAWDQARRETEVGMGALVRDIVRREQVSQAAPRPTTSPPLRPRPTPSFAGPVRPSTQGRQSGGPDGGALSFLPQLMAILLAVEPPPAARLAEITANFEAKLTHVLQKAEAATVKRALHTWQELQGAIAAAGGGIPDKHLLATFIREHKSPTRVYTALGWIVRNLKLPFDLSEVVKPRAGLGSRLGQGQAQAATLEPSMVIHLLGTLESTVDNPHWPMVFCAYALCFGVVRYTHLQRSYLVGGNGGILVFWCTKGKTGSRGGFTWSVPRYCGTLDLLQVLGAHLNKVRPRTGAGFRRWHWLGFDSATSQPVGTAQCVRILRPYLSAAMDVTSLSSYSFRRVLPTLAGYVGLSETERLALGQWVDQSSKSTATTPLRYDSRKQRLGHQLRLAGLHFFQDLNMALWDELPTGYASARWSTCMEEADELLASDPQIRRVSTDSIPGMPVVKTLLPAQVQIIRATGQRLTAALRRKRPAPSAAAGPVPEPTQGPRNTVSTFSFTSPSRPAKRARVEPPPRAAAGGSAQPVTPPKAPPPKVPPVLPVVSPSSASASIPPLRAPPPLPSTSPRASSSSAAAGPSSTPPSTPKVKAMPSVLHPSPERPQHLQEANDAAFDAAARDRWRRPGHSGAPEPPTLIFLGEAGNGSIYLGGLPTDRAWLETHHIGISLSAMDKIAADCRGGVSARQVYQFNVPVGHQGALRDRQLKSVLPIFLATLYSGYSVLIHCMAGVHRAPVLAGLLLAWIRRCSFEEAYSRLEGLRAIDRAGVLSRRGGSDIFKWARSQVNITPPSLPRYPISFIASTKAGSHWHVERDNAPWCRWRQRNAAYRGEVH